MTFDFLKGVDGSTLMLAAGGAAGGLYRWIVLRPKLSDGLIAVVSGTIAASIFGPILSSIIITALPAVPLLSAVAAGTGHGIGPRSGPGRWFWW